MEPPTLLANFTAALGPADGLGPVWLGVATDALIAAASFSLAVTLFLFVRHRGDQTGLRWTCYLVVGFLVLFGTVSALAAAKAWQPLDRLHVLFTVLTAVVGVLAAGVAWWLLSRLRPRSTSERAEPEYAASRYQARGKPAEAARCHEWNGGRWPRPIDTRDRFLGELAHELRSPLTTIRNAAFLLRENGDPQQAERAATLIEGQVRHMARLIDDLSDVQRVVSGQIELHKSVVTAQEVARTAVDGIRSSLEARGHRLSVSMPTEPLPVEVDPPRLRQILAHLMSSAASYQERGGELTLEVAAQGEEVLFRVRDHGAGIEPGQCELLNLRLAQGSRDQARVDSELGLGLSVVRRLVNLHGGMVTALSAGPGQGSEFTVSLPATVSGPPAVADGSALLSGLRILVVDDHRLSADSLREALAYEGAEAHAVYTGAEALTMTQQLQPKVLLVDIGLPDLAGDEVARRLRAMPEHSGLRIIALTGFEEPAHGATPFDHHLVKPVELPDLLRLLARLAS